MVALPELKGEYDAIVYGLAQMGISILDNMASNGGIRVIGVNRTIEKAHKVWPTIERRGLTDRIGIADTLEDAVKYLKSPGGAIFSMIEAPDPRVTSNDFIYGLFFTGSESKYNDDDKNPRKIAALVNIAPQGTVFVDLANSHPESTYRRMVKFIELGLGKQFLGTGVSGGSEGALKGPSIMPGGSIEAYKIVGPLLEAIAARVDGKPCCAYMGDNEAGHFVKNVHNGIEYNIMAALAETYYVLRELTGATPKQLQEVFSGWKDKGLGGYLLDITCEILGMEDPETGKPVLDVILDEAGQKGTGKWTSQIAFDLGVCVEGIAAALNERIHSSDKKSRIAGSGVLEGPQKLRYVSASRKKLMEAAMHALYGTMNVAYAQGFALFTAVNNTDSSKHMGMYNFKLDHKTIANIWRGGCIIRSDLLPKIAEAYTENPQLINLMLAPNIAETLNDQKSQEDWRYFVSVAIQNGLPRDALSASLSYFDNARIETSVATMLQAQRDMFGEHGFGRIDKPGGGKDFHLPIKRAYEVEHTVR